MQPAKYLDFYAPDFRIKIGGNPQKELNTAIINLEVDENLENASVFSLNINEGLDFKTQRFRWLDNDLLSPESGKDIEIYMGYANRPKKFEEPLITGKIMSLSPNFPSTGIPTLTVQGYDYSIYLQKTTVNKENFKDNVKDYADFARIIAQDLNLETGEIDDSDVKPPDTITPFPGESNYSFLKGIADRIGYEFFIRNKEINFRKPKDDKTESLTLKWGRELISFNPRLNASGALSKVTFKGQNRKNPQNPIKGVATPKDVETKEKKAKTAAELAKKVMKMETEVFIHNFPLSDQTDANAIAKATLNRKNKNLIEGNCECIGMPELRPGINVKLEGVGKRFSGIYYIKSVKHSIGDGGYTISFEVRRGVVGST